MKPKDLLFQHRYKEAVEAYKTQLTEHPQDNYYSGLGDALLGLKCYQDALLSFKRDDEISSKEVKGSFPSISKEGAALWLLGKRVQALQIWHQAVAGILNGNIQYADLAGGGTQGLLLWYGAVSMQNFVERDYALKYLKKLRQKKSYGKNLFWPCPVILMILKEQSFKEVLKAGIGSSELSECLLNAKIALLKRRRLCQILFYAACLDRESEDEIACIQKMKICCQLENPIIEVEWQLALAEIESTKYGEEQNIQ